MRQSLHSVVVERVRVGKVDCVLVTIAVAICSARAFQRDRIRGLPGTFLLGLLRLGRGRFSGFGGLAWA